VVKESPEIFLWTGILFAYSTFNKKYTDDERINFLGGEVELLYSLKNIFLFILLQYAAETVQLSLCCTL